MVVDDLVVVGAEPLFLSDYIATGRVVPEKIAAIVSGIAAGCVQAGCALVGGETAEHPGVMRARRVRRLRHRDRRGERRRRPRCRPVRAGRRADRARARPGCTATGTRSCAMRPGRDRPRRWMPPRRCLAAARSPTSCCEPTRIYARDCLALPAECGAHAFAHVTGGGLAGEPAAGAAADARRDRRPVHVGTAADLRADRGSRGGAAARDGAHIQPRRRHGGRRSAGTAPADALSLARNARAGRLARRAHRAFGTGSVRMIGDYAARTLAGPALPGARSPTHEGTMIGAQRHSGSSKITTDRIACGRMPGQ